MTPQSPDKCKTIKHRFLTEKKEREDNQTSPLFTIKSPESLYTKILPSSEFLQQTPLSSKHKEQLSSNQISHKKRSAFGGEKSLHTCNDNRRPCKGLKSLSCKVRHIVNGKKKTSYKEVADQLVSESKHPGVTITVQSSYK